jgi:site-specific recombinase XerD
MGGDWMETPKVTIGELTAQMVVEARRLGYSEASIWRNWMPRAGRIAKYYRDRELCVYDPAVTGAFLQELERRYEMGTVSEYYLRKMRHIARRLNEFYLTGTLRTDTAQHETRYVLSSHGERLVDLFVAHRGYGENTQDDAVWAVRKYLCHFERLGHETLATVTMDDVQRFILEVASEVKTSTLYDLFLYLRHFHIFLKESGEEAPDCVELFSHKVYREMPIQGYVTDEELERILNVIDASTEAGKRNRAMILLSATTGLRACDIIRLKLTDIDWRRGEIRVKQSKTDQVVCLPLLSEAGEALQDYILNARPQNHCAELFLRCAAPKTAIEDASSISTMFKDYERRAGIERQPFDGKGFHGLRRRLAKKLLVSGSPLTMIAQVLGQTDMHSALQYLALDTSNLKECALNFSGIPVERREFQ